MSTDDPVGTVPPASADDVPAVPAAALGSAAAGADLPAIPTGPPWTVDVLADLQAGRYPQELADDLRRRIADDPWATSVVTALDATVDELSLLPVPRMPERFALRLDAAIAAERRTAAPAGVTSAGVTSAGVTGAGVAGAGVTGAGVAGAGVTGAGVTGAGVTGAGVAGAEPAGGRRDYPGPGALDAGLPQQRQAVQHYLSPSRAHGSSIGGQPPPRAVPGPPPGAPRIAGLPAEPPRSVHDYIGPEPAGRSISGPPPVTGPSTANAQLQPGGPSLDPGVPSLDAARAKRRRWVGGLAAAAAVIVLGTVTAVALDRPAGTGDGQAASSPGKVPTLVNPAPGAGNAVQLDPGRLGEALNQIEGRRPAGPLRDPATYASCLAANSIDPSAVTGVSSGEFEGKPAAAIAVRIDAGHTMVVVVGTGCGVDGAADRLAAENVSG